MNLDLHVEPLRLDRNNTTTDQRDIGNRLFAIRILELTIALAMKAAWLIAVIWTINAVLEHIERTSDTHAASAALAPDARAPLGDRARITGDNRSGR